MPQKRGHRKLFLDLTAAGLSTPEKGSAFNSASDSEVSILSSGCNVPASCLSRFWSALGLESAEPGLLAQFAALKERHKDLREEFRESIAQETRSRKQAEAVAEDAKNEYALC